MPSIKIGSILDGSLAEYRVTKVLKPGKFGRTYFAEATQVKKPVSGGVVAGQQVVIKVPQLPSGLSLPVATKFLGDLFVSFALEESCLRRLVSVERVAHFLDRGTVPIPFAAASSVYALFIVVERVKGQDLDKWMSKRTLTAKEFLSLAWDLVTTLREIHREQVVHGDIWFRNIMVDKRGNCHYIDFGQGLFRDLALGTQPTLGVHRFLPPERGKSVSGDIYCLGLLLFFLATGKELPAHLKGATPRAIDDNDELKQAITRDIRAANPKLYEENCGVVDIIARCLRVKLDERATSADQVLEEIEGFSTRSPTGSLTRQFSASLAKVEAKSLPLYICMARDKARRLDTILQDMLHGRFDLIGNHEEIVSGMSQYLSFLGRNDRYCTISQPAFWATPNLGIRGRFLSMNMIAATRGATIRRVFLITEKDEKSPEFRSIIEAQLEAIRTMKKVGVNTTDRKLTAGGYYVGFRMVGEEERTRLVAEGKHCGIMTKGGKGVLAVATYNLDAVIVAIRFFTAPDAAHDAMRTFEEALKKSSPLTAFRFTRPRPSPRRRLQKRGAPVPAAPRRP